MRLTEAIAPTVGVTRPVIYDHFPNLGALIQALIEREERYALSQLAAVVPGPGDSHPARPRLCCWPMACPHSSSAVAEPPGHVADRFAPTGRHAPDRAPARRGQSRARSRPVRGRGASGGTRRRAVLGARHRDRRPRGHGVRRGRRPDPPAPIPPATRRTATSSSCG